MLWSRFTRSVYGPLLRNTPDDRTFELCVGGYAPFVADTIRNYDRKFLFLDIGANLGLFSLLAARHPLCRKAIAIEPLPRIFKNLEANVVRNRAHKVVAVRAAVSDLHRLELYLSYDPRHSGMSKVLSEARPDAVRASVLNAAGLSALTGRWPGSVLAKIDVEGSELDVLNVLRRTSFYGALNDIIVEISSINLGPEKKIELLNFLVSEGFVEVGRRAQTSNTMDITGGRYESRGVIHRAVRADVSREPCHYVPQHPDTLQFRAARDGGRNPRLGAPVRPQA